MRASERLGVRGAHRPRRPLSRLALGAAFACGLAAASGGGASAQAAKGFDHSLFDPSPEPTRNLLSVGTSQVLPHLGFAVGALLHYADDAITVVAADDRGAVAQRAIDSALTADLSVAIGLFDRFSLGVAIPLVLTQTGADLALFDRPGETVDGFAVGDLRVVPKGVILAHGSEGGFGLAVAVPIYLPTGDPGSFRSDEAVRVSPTIIADFATAGGVVVAANVAYQIRPERLAANYVSDDQLRWGLGARVPIIPALSVVGTLFGSYVTKDSRDPLDPSKPLSSGVGTSVEVLGGVEANLGALTLGAGAGTALVHAVGTPDARAYLSLGVSLDVAAGGPDDTDGDGLDDDVDKCPLEAEDKDGFQDGDGCPDPDNDGDGVLDVEDECPTELEDQDDHQDDDGCPDLDNDGDGIQDGGDRCPDAAEDKDGVEDDDGCPEADGDGDGVPDEADKCPLEPEDKDGIQDDDGCPETDGDGDGIVDEKDKCPDRQETKNGIADTDGCPDTNLPAVELTETAIKVKGHVYFVTDSTAINKIAMPVLNQVLQVLIDNPWITRIRCEGHTDSEGSDELNQQLSQKRCESIVEYFVQNGVARERLDAIGYGESRPIAPNTTPYGRSKNRRIDFTILEVNGKPLPGAEPATPPVP